MNPEFIIRYMVTGIMMIVIFCVVYTAFNDYKRIEQYQERQLHIYNKKNSFCSESCSECAKNRKNKKERKQSMPRLFRWAAYIMLLMLMWKFVSNIDHIALFIIKLLGANI